MDERELASVRFDYFSALGDYGICHKDAQAQTTDHSDLIDKPLEGVEVKPSEIHGDGLFSTKAIEPHSLVCIARLGDKRTIAGRYTNHSPNPNAAFLFSGDNIGLVSLQDIEPGDELLVNYRDALSLQLKKPEKINTLVVDNRSISTLVTGRCFLCGLDASAYDLLFSEDHAGFLSSRERVLAFEEILKPLPQLEMEPKHEFIDGLYRREVTFPKGTLATGKIHPHDHMDVMLSGEMIVVSDDGFKHLKGPCFMTSRAGKKKAGYTLTDVVWATYHPTKCTTVEEVEKEIFVDEFLEIDIKEAV